MQTKVIAVLLGFIFSLGSNVSASLKAEHYAKLKEKFPYSLLNDDHGVLTENDLARNACDMKPVPYPPQHYAFQYWQCYETKHIVIDCDSNWEPDIATNESLGLVTVDATLNGVKHEYLMNHPGPLRDCKEFVRDATRLLKGTRYACLSGLYEKQEIDGQSHDFWTLDRIKTKRGCEGTSNCNLLTKKERREMCPDLKF